MNLRGYLATLAAVGLVSAAGVAQATVYTAIAGTGTSPAAWSDAGTWQDGVIPPMSSIDSTNTINLNGHYLTANPTQSSTFGPTWDGAGGVLWGGTQGFYGNSVLASTFSGKFIATRSFNLLDTAGTQMAAKSNMFLVLTGTNATYDNHLYNGVYSGTIMGDGRTGTTWSSTFIVASGGTVIPGTPTTTDMSNPTISAGGKMSLASFDFQSGSTLSVNIFGATPSDAGYISTAGTTRTLRSGSLLSVNLYDPGTDLTGASWTIVESTGGAVNDLSGWTAGTNVTYTNTSFADGSWQNLHVAASGNNLVVTGDFVAVPEPASLGLFGLAGLALLRRRRQA